MDANPSPIIYDVLPDSPLGPIFVAMRREAVVGLDFGASEQRFVERITNTWIAPLSRSPHPITAARQQISAYLAGERTDFDLPVDIDHLSAFQQDVLRATMTIPRGRTITYADLADQLGNPDAIRAVGGALGQNPIPLIIPCHRVIAAHGNLGGYSGSGGVKTKEKLLKLEGALLL